ncbi:hypothetical protein [Microbacterium pygmaeum]|uniref:PKD domain-containing protein n=1 Tax=Microbacterium pygmaeum TaxID=370764 RepID=A0A1G8BBL3_9MICO|nr:hypothetical protein [Microbacterium pygmaeum]SDH30609.1 hypothetical protein SAMN04489810_2750 [Microbacterium pygmaeum]
MRLIFAVVLAVAGLVPSAVAANGCGLESAWTQCEVGNSGSQIDIGAGITNPGSEFSDDQNEGADDVSAPAPQEDCFFDRCDLDYTVVGLPDVTLADLVSFVPARPTLRGEPAGVGVVGMPTNVVAAASAQSIPGRLLDHDVVVGFTPVAFRFDYGDGTSQQAPSGGASWADLGQAQFTPTSTSHAYAARGTYVVAVTVLYSAAVDFGTGWRPVAGFVESTTGGYDVRVVEVRTALVDKTCIEYPTGPGC